MTLNNLPLIRGCHAVQIEIHKHYSMQRREVDIDKLRLELADVKALNQRLMTALETVGKLCHLRTYGKCQFDCPGLMACITEGLELVNYKDFPSAR